MRRDIFQAIADPTRRAIISLIVVQAMTPNAIAEQFATSRQAVSKHIKILQECGLLSATLIGRERLYQVHPDKLREVFDWLTPFRQYWEERFSRLDEVLQDLQKEQHDTNKQ